jgi:hypothetical protein
MPGRAAVIILHSDAEASQQVSSIHHGGLAEQYLVKGYEFTTAWSDLITLLLVVATSMIY